MIHAKSYRFSGCESHLTATSVTLLITKVDLADLVGLAGVPILSHHSVCASF